MQQIHAKFNSNERWPKLTYDHQVPRLPTIPAVDEFSSNVHLLHLVEYCCEEMLV